MKFQGRVLLGSLVLLLACSPKVPTGVIPADQTQAKDSGAQVLEPKVDILFVIDNSGSMGNHQKNVSKNINAFIDNFFDTVQIDFHIGVVTTDTDYGTLCCGILVGTPAYVDRSTPDVRNVLAKKMILGTNGSPTEKVFDPIYMALNEPHVNKENAGFLRKDAFLAIIFLTDAEDQSVKMDPDTIQQFLLTLKKRPSNIISYGVIVPSSVSNCPRDQTDKPARLEQFLSYSPSAGSNEFSLCDSQFGKRIAEIGHDLADRVGAELRLTRAPELSTVRLNFGTQEIPPDAMAGWSYNPDEVSIHIGPQIVWTQQPPDTKITIFYKPTRFPDGTAQP